MKEIVKFEDFIKLDIRAGEILNCSVVEGSEKLVKMQVDFGDLGERQVIAGISKWYECGDLVGKQFLFVVNLEPRKLMGLESQGMVLALGAVDGGRPIMIVPEEPVDNGELVS
jgi:methionine--tRNA ligase beta chain